MGMLMHHQRQRQRADETPTEAPKRRRRNRKAAKKGTEATTATAEDTSPRPTIGQDGTTTVHLVAQARQGEQVTEQE